MKKTKIALFGGTFNPIHLGHLIVADQVLKNLNLDKIIFIPSGNPAQKSEGVVSFYHRYNMVKLSIEGNDNFEVSNYESLSKDKSYTINTWRYFKEFLSSIYLNLDLFFIIGEDSFKHLSSWYKYKEITEEMNFIVIKRPSEDDDLNQYIDFHKNNNLNFLFLDTIKTSISSSEIRKQIKTGIYPKYVLKDDVIKYIRKNKLYVM